MPPRDTLIIKLGALGDVLRTTPLLARLPGRVTWVTERAALPLLAGHPRLFRALPIEAARRLRGTAFDLVINFDEELQACQLASKASAARHVGAYMAHGDRTYCAASAAWFDMSLISRLGRERADALKARNRRSYQDHLFRACGLRFSGEEYWTSIVPRRALRSRVALEPRVGKTWPGKAWPGFEQLAQALTDEGYQPVLLRQRARLLDYLADIDSCGAVVAGDTLAMHAGLALRKPVVGLFTCTSPEEIYGYGRLTKVVGPGLRRHFYSRLPLPDAAMPGVDDVLAGLRVTARVSA